jgi:hypothetical protein
MHLKPHHNKTHCILYILCCMIMSFRAYKNKPNVHSQPGVFIMINRGCCLRDCGMEHFRLSWPNNVSAFLVAHQRTHRLISQGIVERHRDWRSWAWEDGEKGVPVAAHLVLLLHSAVATVCTRPHRCRLRECHLRRLPISRYVYSHHVTLARHCDPLSGGIILPISWLHKSLAITLVHKFRILLKTSHMAGLRHCHQWHLTFFL